MNRKHLIATFTGAALATLVSTAAMAANPPFTLNPSAASPALSGQGAFTANQMQLTANTLIQFAGAPFTANSFTEQTDAVGISFLDSSGNPLVGNGGMNTSYKLFIQASVAGTPSGCTATQCGWDITVANWSMVGDVGTGDTLTTGAVPSTNPTITGPDTLVPLASGGLLTGTATYSILTNQFSLNLNSSIATCTATGQPLAETVNGLSTCGANESGATSFFESPVPFFTIAFDAWAATAPTGTSPPGCSASTCTDVLLNGQTGVFNFIQSVTVVPEPASLTLFGSGLLALGAISRRRRKKAAA